MSSDGGRQRPAPFYLLKGGTCPDAGRSTSGDYNGSDGDLPWMVTALANPAARPEHQTLATPPQPGSLGGRSQQGVPAPPHPQRLTPPNPVPLEYSIGWLTRAIGSRLDVVMVGLPGAAQDRLSAHVPGNSAWPSWCSAATGRRMPRCWCSGTRTRCCVGTLPGGVRVGRPGVTCRAGTCRCWKSCHPALTWDSCVRTTWGERQRASLGAGTISSTRDASACERAPDSSPCDALDRRVTFSEDTSESITCDEVVTSQTTQLTSQP